MEAAVLWVALLSMTHLNLDPITADLLLRWIKSQISIFAMAILDLLPHWSKKRNYHNISKENGDEGEGNLNKNVSWE